MFTLNFAGLTLPRAGVLAAVLLIAGGSLLSAQDKAGDPLLAKVNGVEIHQSDLAIAEEEAGQIPPMAPEAKRDYLVAFLTDMILVSQEAEKKKLAEGPGFKQKLAFARNKLLMASLLETAGKDAVTEAAMRKVYDDAVKQIGDDKEVKARHILIRAAPGDEAAVKTAEAKIKEIQGRLKKGEDFAKVAEEVTEDPSGKATGGDLGFFSKEQMVPDFSTVAFSLEPGQISEPVRTQFGWHLIKLDEKRNKPVPTFDDVKAQVETYVMRRAQADLVGKLRESAKVEKFYKSEAPAEPEKK